MKRKIAQKIFSGKELFVFDLDGTLAESKSSMDGEMAGLLSRLLAKKKVAVIGGGRYKQFQEQFIARFKCPPKLLENIFLFPTTSTSFYRYSRGAWRNVYAHNLTKQQRRKIFAAFERAFSIVGYTQPEKIYGETIEDRDTQISFSALGQDVVKVLGAKKGVALKAAWGKTPWRPKIARALRKLLPEFEVRMGGLSTIDVTKKGIDKAFGIRQIEKTLGIPRKKMLFIGDAIYPGGNDYAVVRAGVEYIKVAGPEETKKVIRLAFAERK